MRRGTEMYSGCEDFFGSYLPQSKQYNKDYFFVFVVWTELMFEVRV
jgi:hypothetical protein